MQPLTKALRRRLRRLAPELSQQDIDRFERERRVAMEAALREDPLYAAALGRRPGPESIGPEAFTAAPPREAAESERVVQQLGSLLQRAAEAEQHTLERKADRALARQGEAARPKRVLSQRTAAKKAASRKPAARKTGATKAPRKKKIAPKRIAAKTPARKTAKRTVRTPTRRGR
ncbi:MAG TPA: hypothetical protein VJL84_04515 [Kiloniellales bacterium]|nr:hypothetical protein [Kiloniellales bacterium]